MESPQAITDWFTSTGLKPYLDPLDEEGRARFSARYTQEMDRRYPPRADGRRLLAFPSCSSWRGEPDGQRGREAGCAAPQA